MTGLFEKRSDEKIVDTAMSSRLLHALMVVTAIYIVFCLYLIFSTRRQLASYNAAEQASITALWQRQDKIEADIRVSNEALAQQLGTTQQDLQERLQKRAAELRGQQRGLAKRLQDQAEQQQEDMGQISGAVAEVQTQLTGAKADIAATHTQIASTNAKLDSAIGDLNGQSHLIARTREELDELRHRGDRNYYEFTLYKGSHATPVSTVSLQLKNVNSKKNRFTLNVIADDRIVEKKDRGVAEPLQFYTGHDRQLYEVVIWTTENNRVTGYLSTPKSITIATAD